MSSASSIAWRDVVLYGTAGIGRYTFATLDGWEELPDVRRDEILRDQAHGAFDSPVFAGARHVLASGRCSSPAQRDAQLLELKASFNLSPTTPLPLTITHAGRALTTPARLLRFKPTSPSGWGTGFWGWVAEWVCSDPLRYGNPVTMTTGFPSQTGGLEFDLYTDGAGADTGFLEYGAAGTSGRLFLTNTGDAVAWVSYEFSGMIPAEGLEIVNVLTGAVIRFEGGVPTGSTVLLDTGAGTALMDGYSGRSGQVTRLDPMPVQPGESIELAVTNLGTLTAGQIKASLTPGWW